MENTEKRLRVSNKIMGGFIMNEEINKKAGELSDDELDIVSGGAAYDRVLREQKEQAAKLAAMQCPACGNKGARFEFPRFICKSCNYVIYNG